MARGDRGRWAILGELSADEQEALVVWFVESYQAGWRPQVYPVRNPEKLHMKAVGLVIKLKEFHRKRKEREEQRKR
jgi:hypothetical protein